MKRIRSYSGSAGLVLALTLAATDAADPRPQIQVDASGKAPDPAATALMPMPIFDFSIPNVAFSPDGRWLSAGDGKGAVHLWDVEKRRVVGSAQAHKDWAFAVAWFPDSARFATGGGDNLVHVFTRENLSSPLTTFHGHQADIHAVLVSQDGERLFSAGDEGRILVRRTDTGSLLHSLPGHTAPIPAMALSKDGSFLASASRDWTIRFWDVQNGKELDSLIGHTADVMALALSPDGTWLASASYDETVRLWEVARAKARAISIGHRARVYGLAFSPSGDRLASTGGSTLCLWTVPQGERLRHVEFGGQIKTASGAVQEQLSSIAYHPAGNLLAVGSTSGRVYLVSSAGEILEALPIP